ncbi:NAD(P)-dependent oxidoreductase [Leptolyngbya valderiana BDU 20041]|nr:NAD(P)-dependent oxidoreductase [Leptolyngbya valderiana BDU 20041]
MNQSLDPNDPAVSGGLGVPHRLFVFGLGYSARQLAADLSVQGWEIAGTTRSAQKASALAASEGAEAFVFDRGTPLSDPATALAGTTHLLSSVPPDAEGDPVLDAHFDDIVALAHGGELQWIGYLSTTGVYGDRAGGWVDETSALEPTGERGRRRVAAERHWLRLWQEHGLPVHLFRLAGIYGPGRSQFAALRAGRSRRIDKPGQVFSRIHVADIAQVLAASIDRPNPGAAYNVCDDEAADPAEVTAHAAELLGMDPPPLVPFATAELSEMGRSFYRDSKRVCNARIKQELGVRLLYPSYREGFPAVLAAETGTAEPAPERGG